MLGYSAYTLLKHSSKFNEMEQKLDKYRIYFRICTADGIKKDLCISLERRCVLNVFKVKHSKHMLIIRL